MNMAADLIWDSARQVRTNPTVWAASTATGRGMPTQCGKSPKTDASVNACLVTPIKEECQGIGKIPMKWTTTRTIWASAAAAIPEAAICSLHFRGGCIPSLIIIYK